MSIEIQLICFSISFILGIVIYLMEQFNTKLVKNKPLIFQVIIMLLAAFVIVIGYVDILYFINGGIFHIYFLIMIIIGYIVGRRKCLSRIKKKGVKMK